MQQSEVTIKSAAEFEKMRAAGALVAQVHRRLTAAAQPGVSTADLDQIAETMTREAGATPSFKGYHGFPACICASINDEIVHGIPNRHRVLKSGDLLSVDFGAIIDGWHGDAAVTIPVGNVDPAALRLVEITREALYLSIALARAGNTLGDIGAIVERHARAHGYKVVREYCGHGIGREMHEEPAVMNHGTPGRGDMLRAGMAIAIEPMLLLGDDTTSVDPDGWTVRTADRKLSAHWEHTVAITENGPDILTRLPDDDAPDRLLAAAIAKLNRRPTRRKPKRTRRRQRGRR